MAMKILILKFFDFFKIWTCRLHSTSERRGLKTVCGRDIHKERVNKVNIDIM